MEGSSGKGYAWAISAGFNAAFAAVAAKLLLPPVTFHLPNLLILQSTISIWLPIHVFMWFRFHTVNLTFICKLPIKSPSFLWILN